MVNSILILAGGDGTRLQSITGGISKPLIKIGNEEVITTIIKKLVNELNIDNIYLLIQKKHADQYEEYLSRLTNIQYNIELVVEDTKLGTGGAIKSFLNNNKIDSFYVSNADTIIHTNISEFKKSDINSILCSRIKNNDRFGSIKIDKDDYIINFMEKKSEIDAIISAGVYKLSRSIFLDIQQDHFDLESIVFPELASKKILKCFLLNLDFEDIGVPEAFHRENERINRTSDDEEFK
jgi:NDP-sugar pyrophosphorylase family protein